MLARNSLIIYPAPLSIAGVIIYSVNSEQLHAIAMSQDIIDSFLMQVNDHYVLLTSNRVNNDTILMGKTILTNRFDNPVNLTFTVPYTQRPPGGSVDLAIMFSEIEIYQENS